MIALLYLNVTFDDGTSDVYCVAEDTELKTVGDWFFAKGADPNFQLAIPAKRIKAMTLSLPH